MSDDIWDYQDNFRYDGEPIDPDSPFWVELGGARGDYDRTELWNQLRYDAALQRLRREPRGQCTLIGGHRGCGKSTELRYIARELQRPEAYLVVELDALRELDIFSLKYGDLLLAMVAALAQRLEALGLDLDPVYVEPIRRWFDTCIEHVNRAENLSAELATGAQAETGFPLVGKLFAKLTTAIKTDVSYRKEVRREVQDGFATLARAFDTLTDHAAERVRSAEQGRALLFVIDGLDRLQPEDADNFFVHGIDQLRQLRVPNLLICAPMRTLIEKSQVGQTFEGYFKVPMIKLENKDGSQRFPEAHDALARFLTRRLPERFFGPPEDQLLQRYIDASGGHPRDLLRLINLSFTLIRNERQLTPAIAERACKRLSGDYQNLVNPDDFPLLREIDRKPPSYKPVTERTRRLLYDLVLLEYNASWWRTHPAVRALDDYRESA